MGGRTMLALATCAVLAVGACNERNGLELDVTVPDTVDSVEVVLGGPTCNRSDEGFTCYNGSSSALGTVGGGIAWASGLPVVPGYIHEWLTTSTLESVVPTHRATYLLDTSTLKPQVGAIAIIGLDGSGKPEAMTVLDVSTLPNRAQLSIALPEVTNVDPPPTSGAQTPAAHLWGSGSANCLAWFPPTEGSAVPPAQFIVPADDHDCDGWTIRGGNECDDYWADSATLGGYCGSAQSIGSAMPCVLGSAAGCTDGHAVGSIACLPLAGQPESCVPDLVCDVCQPPLAVGSAGCFMQDLLPASTSMVSHAEIDCTFPYAVLTNPQLCLGSGLTSEPASVYTLQGPGTFAIYNYGLPPQLLLSSTTSPTGATMNVGSGADFDVEFSYTAIGSGTGSGSGSGSGAGSGSGSGSGSGPSSLFNMTLDWISGFPTVNSDLGFEYFVAIGSASPNGPQAMIPLVIRFVVSTAAQPCPPAMCTMTSQTADEVWACSPPGM